MHYRVSKQLIKVGQHFFDKVFNSTKEKEDALNELTKSLDFDFDEIHEAPANNGIYWDFFKCKLHLEEIKDEKPLTPNIETMEDGVYLLLIDMSIQSNLKLKELLSIDLYQLKNDKYMLMCMKDKDKKYIFNLFDNLVIEDVKGMAIYYNNEIKAQVIMKNSTEDELYYNNLYKIFKENFKL